MEDQEIMEAQRRLEERRVLLKQTQSEQTGSEREIKVGDVIGECVKCGSPVLASEGHAFFSRLKGDFWQPPKDPVCNECDRLQSEKREQEEREREQRIEERARRERATLRLEDSGIGERFRSMVWDDYKPTNKDAASVKRICREYADSFTRASGDLVMIGSCGTGKNMLASLIGKTVIERDLSYRYTTAMRLVRQVKDSWRDKEASEQRVIDSFSRPDLLCIDEIGVQFGSPTEQLYISEVINNRYEAMRPTILISNLTIPQVEEVIGMRAIDRFHERGKFLVFNWESYRRKR